MTIIPLLSPALTVLRNRFYLDCASRAAALLFVNTVCKDQKPPLWRRSRCGGDYTPHTTRRLHVLSKASKLERTALCSSHSPLTDRRRHQASAHLDFHLRRSLNYFAEVKTHSFYPWNTKHDNSRELFSTSGRTRIPLCTSLPASQERILRRGRHSAQLLRTARRQATAASA